MPGGVERFVPVTTVDPGPSEPQHSFSSNWVLMPVGMPAMGKPMPVTVRSSNPEVAWVDGPVTLEAGAQSVLVHLQTGMAGTAILEFEMNGEVHRIKVTVEDATRADGVWVDYE